jgi:hypothetical protein
MKCWKVWVAGIALVQLLIIGVDVTLLMPSEAELMAASLHKGMTQEQMWELLGEPGKPRFWREHLPGRYAFRGYAFRCVFTDGSRLFVFVYSSDERLEDFRVAEVRINPPLPVPPLTRFRRILARILPFLEN